MRNVFVFIEIKSGCVHFKLFGDQHLDSKVEQHMMQCFNCGYGLIQCLDTNIEDVPDPAT